MLQVLLIVLHPRLVPEGTKAQGSHLAVSLAENAGNYHRFR
ncbi:hypothetical protein ACFOHY_21570 [Rhizobium rosettiformans]